MKKYFSYQITVKKKSKKLTNSCYDVQLKDSVSFPCALEIFFASFTMFFGSIVKDHGQKIS